MATAYDQRYGNDPNYTKDQWGTYWDKSGNMAVNDNGVTDTSKPAMGSGFLSGINFNGGIVDVPQNYSNASDPFSVGYGTANPSAGTGQWQANTNPTQANNANPFVAGGGNVGQPQGNTWQANTKPLEYNAPQGSNPFTAGGGNANQWQGSTNPTAAPQVGLLSNGQAAPAMQSNFAGGLEVNPYLSQMGSNLVNEVTGNFQRNVLPQMRSQMMAAGGIGSSREGVLQANALRDLNSTLGNALGNLYGQGYVQAGNQALGRGNLELGYSNLDRNINNDNLNWQLQGANFGLGIQDRLNASNAIGLGAGQTIQDTPLNYYSQFSNMANALGRGYGTQTQSGGGSNPLIGALGGAQLGRQIGNWWSTNNQPPASDPNTWFSGNSGLAD